MKKITKNGVLIKMGMYTKHIKQNVEIFMSIFKKLKVQVLIIIQKIIIIEQFLLLIFIKI